MTMTSSRTSNSYTQTSARNSTSARTSDRQLTPPSYPDFLGRVSVLLGTDVASLRAALAAGAILSDLLATSGLSSDQVLAALREDPSP